LRNAPARCRAGARLASVIAVSTKPGATAFTLIPNGPSSIASVRVKPECRPWPRSSSSGRGCRVRDRADVHDLAVPLVDHLSLRGPASGTGPAGSPMTVSQSSSVILCSRLSRVIPALLTRMSRPPAHRSWLDRALDRPRPRRRSRSERAAPASVIARTVSAVSASARSTTATAAPSGQRCAVAAPIRELLR
jgi:hypothetical protein